MSITYTSFVSEIATITVISSNVLVNGDNNFQGIIPQVIDLAEGMLWRDLDLPVARVTDTSVLCASGVRTIALSTTQGTLLAIESLNLFSSAGTTSSNTTRVPVIWTSKAVIDAVYPSPLSSNCGLPQYAARVTDTEVMFGPTPDQNYGTEVIATIRPAPLSASNPSTWLTQNLPELMIAAGMVAMSGYMRNFGAQADDPKMAVSWKGTYDELMKSAVTDSLRMKFQAQQWTSQIPSPIATPPRS